MIRYDFSGVREYRSKGIQFCRRILTSECITVGKDVSDTGSWAGILHSLTVGHVLPRKVDTFY